MRIAVFLLAPAVCALLSACAMTPKEASDREWQRAECNRIIDQEARERCLKRVE